MKTRLPLAGTMLAAGLMSFAASAGYYHWVGGDASVGGKWNTAANWVNDSTQAAEVPSPGSTVVISNSVVAGDDDAALFCSLKKIRVGDTYAQNKAALTLDVSTNVTLGCAISGYGRFSKKGGGTATFAAADTADAFVTYYSMYGVYYLTGGIYVDEGEVVLSQTSAFVYDYGGVHVAQGASVVLCANNTTCIESLYGLGDVRQDGATERSLQFGWNRIQRSPAVFGGKLTGKLSVLNYANQIFTGEENDFTGSVTTTYGAGMSEYGRLGAAKLGMLGSPSSLGKKNGIVFMSYGGHFAHVGTSETSDRPFVTCARNNTGLMPQYFDAGTNGGLRLTGRIELLPYGSGNSGYNMRSFVFTGSNSVASTMAGPLKLGMEDGNGVRYDFYIRKEGPGEWRFENNPETTFRGVFDVREGTLSFDSLADAGNVCALGYSTRLSKEFTGKWDESQHQSRYAFRVGTTNLANAVPAVFAFVGSNSCSSADRPLLLTGDAHFRADGTDGASVDFADVSADAGAVKTLTLDGTNTAENVMRKIADGDGRVSVVKAGPGRWALRDDQTFSGTLAVKAGELAVRDREPYSWYRLTIRENPNDKSVCSVGRIAFYDADGKLLTKNMSFVRGEQYESVANYYHAVDPAGLLPGECCYAPFSSTPSLDNYFSTSAESPAVIFNGGGAGGGRVYYKIDTTLQGFNSNYPGARLVFRLPAGSPEAVRYDISTLIANSDWSGWRISAWTVEGSSDGANWVELDKVDGKTDVTQSEIWYSDGETAASGDDRSPGDGFELDLPESADQLAHVESVSVAPGARLTIGAECEALEIGKIVVDGAVGAGKICGGAFATALQVDVVGDIPVRGGTFPVDFGEVGNVENLQPVFTVNGQTSEKYSFRLTASELTILPSGMLLIVK